MTPIKLDSAGETTRDLHKSEKEKSVGSNHYKIANWASAMSEDSIKQKEEEV